MTDLKKKKKAFDFCAMLNDSRETETFTFFTDPHLYNKGEMSDEEEQKRAERYLSTLHDYYCSTPMNFIMCGGDWLGDSDTCAEAKGKLGMIDGFMRSNFHDYYPIIGNHDTNYQGVDENGKQLGTDRALSPAIMTNLQCRPHYNPYYAFNGVNTRVYVLDSCLDWNAVSMNEYKWEELFWLAGELEKDCSSHIALALHMWWWYEFDSPPSALTSYLTELISAFNRKNKVEWNGRTFDFSNTVGRIEFIISGHTHADWTTKVDGCPVFSTTMMRHREPTFDMIFVDYDNRRLHCVRVGAGNDRTFDLDTGDLIE